jgi:hypothetical protein
MYYAPMERGLHAFGRGAVALVWLYNGAWCKLAQRCPDHVAIVSTAFDGATVARAVLLALGAVETGLALWVLVGWRPRLAAAVQTLLVAGMNAGGLLWGGAAAPHAGDLIVRNLAFVALVWLVAVRREGRDGGR